MEVKSIAYTNRTQISDLDFTISSLGHIQPNSSKTPNSFKCSKWPLIRTADSADRFSVPEFQMLHFDSMAVKYCINFTRNPKTSFEN